MTLAQPAKQSALSRYLARREVGVGIILVLVIAIVSGLNPRFIAADNIGDMLVRIAPGIIVGVGLTFVIVTGEIDISVGSLMGLLAAIMGIIASPERLGWPVPVAVATIFVVGAFVGFLNGFLVTVGRVPSIIVTLGMLTLLRGITQKLMHGAWVQTLPQSLRFFGTGNIVGIPVSVLLAALTALAAIVFTYQVALGRRIYAVGSNPSAAPLAGLSTRRVKLFVFTLTGALVALATLISVPQLSTIDLDVGRGFELFVVTAVVVGGTSISGGRGTIVGMILGVILLSIMRSVLLFLNLGNEAVFWERAIQGAFILIAVLVDHVTNRREVRR